MKSTDKIFVEGEGYKTAKEVAIDVAKTCHGKKDWRGVMAIEANSGLEKIANNWLKKNSANGKARVKELVFGDGTSKYQPYWI